MRTIYFTVTGTNHYHGMEFLENGMEVNLEKEPDNEFDKEAIKVTLPGLEQIGYVSNNTFTIIGESMSAGRIYDKIGDTARGKILYKVPKGVLCILNEEDIITFENMKE